MKLACRRPRTGPDAAGGPKARGSAKLLAALLVAAATAGAPATAQPFGERFLLGVGTHQGIEGAVGTRGYLPERTVSQIREMGFNSFRDDMPWMYFDRDGEQWAPGKDLARLTAQLGARAARPLLILGGGHHEVSDSLPPLTDAARTAFTVYATSLARRFADQQPILELWNEWNIIRREDPRYDADTYASLARQTLPALRKAFPEGVLLVGAIGDDPGWAWTSALLQRGILDGADGLSVHLYNHCATDRSADEIMERLQSLQRLVASRTGKADYPLYITEVGWPTTTGTRCGVSRQKQADNMAQLLLLASASESWLKGIWLYELRDSGRDARDLEHNFGLYDFDNAPKPAACAVQDVWRFVRPAERAEVTRPRPGVTAVRLATKEGQKLAVWSSESTAPLEFRIDGADGATVGQPCGAWSAQDGGRWLKLSGTPTLVRAAAGASLELAFRPAP